MAKRISCFHAFARSVESLWSTPNHGEKSHELNINILNLLGVVLAPFGSFFTPKKSQNVTDPSKEWPLVNFIAIYKSLYALQKFKDGGLEEKGTLIKLLYTNREFRFY